MRTVAIYFTIITFLTLTINSVYAADLIVEEGAVAPNYASIQDAVDNAQPGDRIFIKNKDNNIHWFEAVTIDKPITLLPLENDSSFLVKYTYSIAPDPAHFNATHNTITIIGMHNDAGSIVTNTNTTSEFIRINIISCLLTAGSIDLDDSKYYTHITGNKVYGSITGSIGVISGNMLSGYLSIQDPGFGAGDTTYIIGNRIVNLDDPSAFVSSYIGWSNNSQYMYIANNYIRSNSNYAILLSAFRGSPGGHTVVNNTIETGSSSYTDGIYANSVLGAGDQLLIANNVFHDESDSDGYSETAINIYTTPDVYSLVIINYNTWQGYAQGFTNASTNTYQTGNVEGSTAFDADNITGECLSPECIDGGSPGEFHTDLDLTRNDCGTAGGSFNYNNFFPILTHASRVYFVKTPRAVVQGNSIDVEAEGYDK